MQVCNKGKVGNAGNSGKVGNAGNRGKVSNAGNRGKEGNEATLSLLSALPILTLYVSYHCYLHSSL